MTSGPSLWSSILSEAEKRVRKQQFNTWFPNIGFLNLENNTLHLQVPNSFVRDWLQAHYAQVLKDSARTVTGGNIQIEFCLRELDDTPGILAEAPGDSVTSSQQTDAEPAASRAAQATIEPVKSGMRLHVQYTFENFIVGPSNNLAHAAALAVAEEPSHAYNPLFMHGSVGLGKTHLIQAIAHALMSRAPKPKVLYMSCESFMNEFISAVRHGDIENFRLRFRQLDALLVDDIHFLGKGDRTQEEFFHTFNALYNDQKQIVLTSDSPPKEIPAIKERLVSRFKWGLVTRISPPGYEMRVAIIQKKAQLKGKLFPEDSVHYIAEQVSGNIREIEGALLKVISYAGLVNRSITLGLTQDALSDMIDREKTTISIEDIQNAVIRHFKIKLSDLQIKRRSKAVAYPRQVAMYLARKLTNHSLEAIGGYFGGRDHTTVLHACNKIEKNLAHDSLLSSTIEKLTEELSKNTGKR